MRRRPRTLVFGARPLLTAALLLLACAGPSFAISGNSAATCHDSSTSCSGMACAEVNQYCDTIAPGMCGCVIIKSG